MFEVRSTRKGAPDRYKDGHRLDEGTGKKINGDYSDYLARAEELAKKVKMLEALTKEMPDDRKTSGKRQEAFDMIERIKQEIEKLVLADMSDDEFIRNAQPTDYADYDA